MAPLRVFYTDATDSRAGAVLHLEVDPVGLVHRARGRSRGLLSSYVNERPYVANSLLSVAIARSFSQAMSGRSKDRQAMADQALPLEARITPVSVSGRDELVRTLFAPLGYETTATRLSPEIATSLLDVRIKGNVRLQDLLRHLYVLIPVLNNRKHYWVGEEEVENLLEKGAGWLADHPARTLITRRALKSRRKLAATALARLRMEDETDAGGRDKHEDAIEKSMRLHDLRLEAVAGVLREQSASNVLDLGCGEGKLVRRLAREPWMRRITGVDASASMVERARKRCARFETAPDTSGKVSIMLGSLTYADRRWHGFDAATLVEVIEHVDPPRLPALERSLFGVARPSLVAVTTPNRDYNAVITGLEPGGLRHADHRFEWTRAEFREWAVGVGSKWGYSVTIRGVGEEAGEFGSPSQLAVFKRRTNWRSQA